MKIVIQRVSRAKVTVGNKDAGGISRGLLLLVGVGKDDGMEDIKRMSKKVAGLRVFEDDKGKMNLNIAQAGGEVLSIPQFTLYADLQKGNRPGFEAAAEPKTAKEHWERFNTLLRNEGIGVKEGVFGARMEVELTNDGPVTIIL